MPITSHPYWKMHAAHIEVMKSFLDSVYNADQATALFDNAVSHASSLKAFKQSATHLDTCLREAMSRTIFFFRACVSYKDTGFTENGLHKLKELWAALAEQYLSLMVMAFNRMDAVGLCIATYEVRRNTMRTGKVIDRFLEYYTQQVPEVGRVTRLGPQHASSFEEKINADPFGQVMRIVHPIRDRACVACKASDAIQRMSPSSDFANGEQCFRTLTLELAGK